MYLKKPAITFLFILASFLVFSQEATGIVADVREMSKETDPLKCIRIKERIIKDYKLDSLKDAETIDMLNGTVAIAFVMKKQYREFTEYIGLIKNRFNQTSMLISWLPTLASCSPLIEAFS